ncbi:heme/hemin ABC transporter substrate-binding protein [Vibrio methylphosphonaticus]|uniref:heme/hemin ABC transporter substrate-binding protein n=1 Tax=Vibrio methylphosphonaticus TaxID=2946866 RepID=UPI00202A3517|nr:ABC transporter substrate-binding protein [Vibrio methylphosphonaticus]MCL9773874.1 ABC transporter substrate-binding protein [Vibrio methylphosphonaticus]
MLYTLRKMLFISTITSVMAFNAFAQPTQAKLDISSEDGQNIISAGASVTELLFALKAQSQLVAVDVTSVLPPTLALPKVGYHRALSAEGLLAMHPDLIIGTDEMGPKPALEQLKQAGVKVEVVDTSANITGLKKRIDQIAVLTHTQHNVAALKDKIDAQLDALTSNQPSTSNEKKKILFLLIHEGRPANVAGSGTTPDAIISLAGGINPAATKLNAYKPLSNEAIIEMQPDIILVSDRSYRQLGGADALLKALPMLAATPAGKSQKFVTIDGHALVGGLGLKSLSEAQRLNEQLYAE